MACLPRLPLLSLLCLITLLLVGCPKQPAAVSAVAAPAASPVRLAAAGGESTPGHPEAPAGDWGCLYEGVGGVYWLGATPGAQPVEVLPLPGEDNSVETAEVSPDGSRLAVTTGSWVCQIVGLSTGERTEVWQSDKDPGPLAWSPTGDKLAYVVGGVMSVRSLDGPSTTLVSDKRVTDLAWSPDGTRIAYGRRDDNDQDLGLFVVPTAGGSPRQLAKGTKDVFGVADIAWSPDGKRLAFMHAWEGGALCFVNADGSGYRPNIGPAFGTGRWLPDGSAVVYQASPSEMETLGIFRCSPTGKPAAVVTGSTVEFDMLPSGRLLVIVPPGERSKQPSYLKILPFPEAKAKPEWKGSVPGSAFLGRFQPDGSHFALWVQDREGNESLWMAATGQAPTKRAENVKRLLGWSLGPAR